MQLVNENLNSVQSAIDETRKKCTQLASEIEKQQTTLNILTRRLRKQEEIASHLTNMVTNQENPLLALKQVSSLLSELNLQW